MLPRNLPVVGFRHHIVAHANQDRGYVFARRLDAPHEGLGEGRVATRAILRDIPRLRGKADQRADTCFNGGQTAADAGRARSHRASEVARQGIVPARVQENHAAIRLAFHRALHEIEPHHFKIERRFRRQFGVDRRQIVAAIQLKPVPGIKEDADIRPGKASGERMYLLIHFGLGEITALDDGKAEPAQCRSHVGGIVGRIV